jgi:hypothetical protein
LLVQPHPLAKLFPKYGEEELLDLASDIAANGLHNPIVLYQGQILDGVNRHQVCLAAEVIIGRVTRCLSRLEDNRTIGMSNLGVGAYGSPPKPLA